MDHQRLIDWADDRIVEDSRLIIVAFLVLTAVFAVGLGNISTAAGTQQFTTGLPAEEALSEIDQEFSPTFGVDTGSTQLIQRGGNVLSRQGLLRMLRSQAVMADIEGLRVTGTSSAAGIVATQLDPQAKTLDAKIRAVEDATDGDIDRAVRAAAAQSPRFTGTLSNDFNAKSASASATIGVVTHEVPSGVSSSAGQGGSSPLTAIQQRAKADVARTSDGSITVFGSGILAQEFSSVIVDSLLIVVPAALLFIVFFLVIAYRDLMDLLLGLFALLMTIVWTFGFMGLAGIAFSQMLIAVPPLLLAVGIDFGIHAVNRYREEQVKGIEPGPAMRITTDQLLVAFFIVTGTTVIGFMANFASSLAPIRDFGLVASIGIGFTFLTFGVFLAAAKVELDRARSRWPIPTLSTTPLGAEGSRLGSILRGGVVIGDRAPVLFLLIVVVASAGIGAYATGVNTTFEQEDFLPPEDSPDFLEQLPEPFAPSEYTVTGLLNYLEDNFESTQSSQATVFVEGRLQRDSALEELHRAGVDPPGSFVESGGRADGTSIVTVIESYADSNPEFRQLVDRNDHNDNGIPDDNLDKIYDALLDSPVRESALSYITEDRRTTRLVYTIEADANNDEVADDAQQVAGRLRFTAIATGQTVVFQAVSDLILESAIVSLALALLGSAIFLLVIYRILEGYATLGIANLVPIAVTVALVAGSMRYVGIPFNAITATILAITIGLGVDYSVHVTHRFADERDEHDLMTALDRTVRGTGGALLGSMLTTVFGIGVLSLALFPAIGQFGVLTGLSIVYAFLTSLFVLPPTLVIWDAIINGGPTVRQLLLPWERVAEPRPATDGGER